MILRLATVMLILFWLFTQVLTIIAIESEYHTVVSEYSQFLKENPANGLSSSWAVVAKYKNEFDGTYGRNESLPNRVLFSNSGFYLGFTPLFLVYLEWFDGYEKLVVIQKKGNCGEFAIAIKTLLRDVTGLKTRIVHMEGLDHAFPEVYWNGSWWVFDAIFTTPDYPVKAGRYANYLKENKRDVYYNLYNLKEDETGTSVLAEHGFKAVNITIVAIIDQTSSKSDDKPAKDALVEIFVLKNWYDPLVDRGKTNEEGKYQIVLRRYGDYVIVAKSSDGQFVGILEVDGGDLKDENEIVVRLHKYE